MRGVVPIRREPVESYSWRHSKVLAHRGRGGSSSNPWRAVHVEDHRIGPGHVAILINHDQFISWRKNSSRLIECEAPVRISADFALRDDSAVRRPSAEHDRTFDRLASEGIGNLTLKNSGMRVDDSDE